MQPQVRYRHIHPVLAPGDRVRLYRHRNGDKPSSPYAPHWVIFGPTEKDTNGMASKEENVSNIILDTGLLTSWEEGGNGPHQGDLDSTPFCSSVYTANLRVDKRRFPMSSIPRKGDTASSETPTKGFSKFFWRGPKPRTPLPLS